MTLNNNGMIHCNLKFVITLDTCPHPVLRWPFRRNSFRVMLRTPY